VKSNPDQKTKGPKDQRTLHDHVVRIARWSLGLFVLWSFGLSHTRADDWAPNLNVTAAWDSNATNADEPSDQIDSLRLTGDILASQRYAFGRDDALYAAMHFGGEWWPRYNGLTSGTVGGRAEWRHQFGPDPRAPIVALEGFADAVIAKETGRRGVATGVLLSARKRFNDLTRGTVVHEISWFDARYGTYDRAASETSLELDRDLSPVMRITLTGRFRDGDVVSYASGARPDLEALAPQRVETGNFARTMTAYRIDAQTWSARAAFVRALDDSSAVVLGYEWRRTKRESFTFRNHILSVALIHQF
jgi:hypothetical protein